METFPPWVENPPKELTTALGQREASFLDPELCSLEPSSVFGSKVELYLEAILSIPRRLCW
jgi:hypothetical protein